MTVFKFVVGDEVEKVSGDYEFRGQIRAAFTKRNGLVRYVVENGAGILHIFSERNLKPVVIATRVPTSADLSGAP